MKKENFISLILGTAGGMLFALGMCMTLLPEWNTFKECMVWEGLMIQGILVGILGIVLLLCLIPLCKGLE